MFHELMTILLREKSLICSLYSYLIELAHLDDEQVTRHLKRYRKQRGP